MCVRVGHAARLLVDEEQLEKGCVRVTCWACCEAVPAEMKEDLDTIWKPKKNQAPGDQPGGSA
jgi:hypothetical protein